LPICFSGFFRRRGWLQPTFSKRARVPQQDVAFVRERRDQSISAKCVRHVQCSEHDHSEMGSPAAGHLLYSFVLGQRRFFLTDSPQVQLALHVMDSDGKCLVLQR
jgi:hypothetical protein